MTMQSACPYFGVTWNNLRVLQYGPDRRWVIVECLNKSCGVRFSLPVHRIKYEHESCRSCGRTKPLIDTQDPTLQRRSVNQQIKAERQEAQAAKEAEEQRQKDLLAQAEADAKAARKALIEAERVRKQVEAEAEALRQKERERQAAEAREQALIAEREVAIGNIIHDLTPAEAIECKHIVIAWGQSISDPAYWAKAKQTVLYARQQRQQQQ